VVSYRVALALHPRRHAGTPYANPTRGGHRHGHLDRTADHHQPPPIHALASSRLLVATVLVVAELGVGGIWDIARIPYVRDLVTHLGYPSYFLVLLES
jgi:hypothetical protein